MSDRTLDLDDRLYNYILDNSLREHPAQTALREPKSRREPRDAGAEDGDGFGARVAHETHESHEKEKQA